MTRDRMVLAAGLVANSGLYLVAVFVAGLYWHNHIAAIAAIATMGVVYLCYLAQLVSRVWGDFYDRAAEGLLYLSIALGIGAGLALL